MKTALRFNTLKSTKQTATTTGISNYTNRPVKTLDLHAHSFDKPQPWQTGLQTFPSCPLPLLFQGIPMHCLQKPQRGKIKVCSG